MEIEEKLNEFMEIAYASIEETTYYPTVVNNINDIRGKDLYLKNQCAYHCNYFLIKKIEK